jgi:hypothetical protein
MKRYLASLAAVLIFGAAFLGMGATAGAQEPAQNDAGAARVSFIHGDVSTQHSDSSDWVAGTLNTPVVTGDHISTGKRSRAEVQLDHANILRMSDESTANVVNLSRTQMQLQVGQGLVNYDVLKNNEANVEIDTPNVAIRPQMGEGSYRISVNSNGETVVDVRKGSAEISTPQGSTRVDKNQRITIQGNADNAQYNVSDAPGRDDWDKWNGDRDHIIENAESWHHTNPYYTGTQDLDSYGHWREVPDYGSVWFPGDDPGWVPYRDGRWVYEPYYGWTWVSYEPWGWAPYHYGRWFVYEGNWGWWPGPVYDVGYYPVWAPAYVSFFGFGGGGWGVNFGFGFGGYNNIGWLPCGPGDRFFPWYGRENNRVNVVNITNITNITNINNNFGGREPLRERGFSNVDRSLNDEHVRGGISSMRGDQFGRGRVPMQQSRIDPGSLRQANVLTGAHPVTPSRESFRSSDRQVNPSAVPSRAVANQRFFSNARQGASVQTDRSQNGFNRGGTPGGAQPQQNTARPGPDRSGQGFHGFGANNSGNVNPGSRQGGPNPGASQSQQNTLRPGFHNFGPNNSGNLSRGSAPAQPDRPRQENIQGQRGFTPPSSQQTPSSQSARPGWHPFTPPSHQSQPDHPVRNFEAQGGGQQSRPNSPQSSEPQRQIQNNSRGNSSSYGYSRPPINMQQPVVTPRGGGNGGGRSSGGGYSGSGGYGGGAPSGGGSYSYPRSAPSGGGYSGGASSGVGYRGGASY